MSDVAASCQLASNEGGLPARNRGIDPDGQPGDFILSRAQSAGAGDDRYFGGCIAAARLVGGEAQGVSDRDRGVGTGRLQAPVAVN